MIGSPDLWWLVAGSAGTSVVLTGAVRAYALRHAVLDLPNERSSHTTATPRGGGLALLGGAIGTGLLAMALGIALPRDVATLGLGSAALGVVGWIDDHRGLSARVRLAIQLAVAVWTVTLFHGLPVVRVGTLSVSLGSAGGVLAVLGIVWSINLFNFMDGIDGLAGSQAVLVMGAAALLLARAGEPSLAAIALLVAAASLGFLAWNWPPAKIFLGDVGSGALGYLVAGLAVASEDRGSVPLVLYLILGAVFFGDATITLVRRLARGHGPAEAHREHVYQRLARRWNSHRAVTSAAALLTAGFAALAALAQARPALVVPCLLATYAVVGVAALVTERTAPMAPAPRASTTS